MIARKAMLGAFFIVFVMLFSGAAAFEGGFGHAGGSSKSVSDNHLTQAIPPAPIHMMPVSFSPGSVSENASYSYGGNTNILVTFSFQNQGKLTSLLENLSNPKNPEYHKYLTRSQFASEFSLSQSEYAAAINYFEQFPGIGVKGYSDRVSLELTGPAAEVGRALNTSFVTSSPSSKTYYANSVPELPQFLASKVSQVTGLTNSKIPVENNLFVSQSYKVPKITDNVDGGYPAPVNSSGVQNIYGSDLQVAYNEQTLLNITYPTNEVIATILWAGENSSGTPVGSFDPSDIYSYFNATLPSYEPHSKVYGVPLNGAVKPGISASYDTTGVNTENTLDLEMVGSTAPGSSIYNVYGPNSTMENLDSALAFILNPNSTYSALNNVSVISNSWGGPEFNNTVWYQYLQEAQARGITVLASSGDSGDNNQSSKYSANPYHPGDYVQFPASMAYNDFGITSVGGTTLTLSENLHILNQTAWYESNLSTGGNPAGSAGGISEVFNETSWQLNSEANSILHGSGLGVPDIAAIGNNTIIFQSTNGVEYQYTLGGTSVASPIEAGIVAEMNAVLNHYNQPNLGYLNPLIYNLANRQVTTPPITNNLGYIPTGDYNSSLPTLPFYNVMYGRNHLYNATFGYNLVTGWGSIDAYNFSMYVLNINRSSNTSILKGVMDVLKLNGLNVTSYQNYSTVNGLTVNTSSVNHYYNASIQQNLFIANQFGAPIYWIQNVVYINGSQSSGWIVNYTGWVVYPFYGQYPYLTLYEYNFPLGKVISMPHTFDVKTWISNISRPMYQTVNFEVNSQIISLPVPGAAYIIDSHNYSYVWQGKTYYNGPFPDNPYQGGLDPQFGLIGGPSGGLGIFGAPTSGTVSAYIEPMDMNGFVPASTSVFNLSIDETGEEAAFLGFSPINGSAWTISVNNDSLAQGIVDFSPSQYEQTFSETGLPSGTTWGLSIDGKNYTSSANTISVNLPNGTYAADIISPSGYFPTPSSGIVSVSGSQGFLPITFAFSSNETYIKPALTIYPAIGQIFSGTVALTNYTNYFSFGMAYDNRSNLLFIPIINETSGVSKIYVYNTSTNNLVKSVPGYYAYNALFDYQTGYLYTISVTGNLSQINPSTMAIVKNVSVPDATGISTLEGGGNNIYVFAGLSEISEVNASTMTVVKTISVGSSSDLSPIFYVSGDYAYFANTTGDSIMIVDLTTSSIKQVPMPADYAPESVIPYYGSDLLIGGYNYSDQIYNITTGSLSTGPMLSFTVSSETYDPLTHLDYVFSAPLNGYLGNLTAVNPVNGDIVSRIPGVGLELSSFYDALNQNIFTINYPSGVVSVYSVQHYYSATFTESGLPAGTTWYVNLTDGKDSGPITGSSYSLTLANGTYSYTVATTNRTYSPSPSSGSFTVNGAPVSEIIAFSKVQYKVTFYETQLPAGPTWYVNGTGLTGHEVSPSDIVFMLSNGTYTFTVTNLSDYYTTTSHFTVTIDGSNVTETVLYYHWAYISGTLSPGNATLTINGHSVSVSSGGTFNVSVTSGTYHVVASESGYNTYYNNFTLNFGSSKNLTIDLKTVSKPSSISPFIIYGAIGAVVIVIIGAIVAVVLKRR